MAAPAVQNPPAPAESKSAKKKKAKAVSRAESPAPASTPAEKPSSVVGDAAQEDGESPYIRDLQKNIRNVNKKIQNISKTDTVVAENKDKSLDELVNLKIINADQRASILNKPRLLTQLAQYEEQLAQYKKIDLEYRTRAAEVKAEVERALTQQHEKDKSAAVAEIKSTAEAESKKLLHSSLLVLSQFLRLAAARRGDEHSSELDENRALEGVLLQVYSGDEEGVATMLKLVHGSEERTKSVTGDDLQTTFAQVKEAAIAHAVPLIPSGEEPAVDSKAEIGTDPTVANAGLTEIDAGTDVALTNGNHTEEAAHTAPANAEVADEAANASAEATQWDAGNASMSASQEWVKVPENPAETETAAPDATPAAQANNTQTNTQSWADDATENATDAPAAPADANDGFQSVPGRNRGRGEGGWRGRGNYRGRGNFRGEGRGRGRGGRGRGGDRGGDGPFRGQQRRSDDAQ